MFLGTTTQAQLTSWINATKAAGRFVTRLPFAIGLVQAGQLGSRLVTPNPSLGPGPAQWDYQPAPLTVRIADNWQQTTAEVAAQIESSIPSLNDIATATGTVVHQVFALVGDATAAALGIPVWLLWGGIAFAGYYALTHMDQTRHVAERAAVLF